MGTFRGTGGEQSVAEVGRGGVAFKLISYRDGQQLFFSTIRTKKLERFTKLSGKTVYLFRTIIENCCKGKIGTFSSKFQTSGVPGRDMTVDGKSATMSSRRVSFSGGSLSILIGSLAPCDDW